MVASNNWFLQPLPQDKEHHDTILLGDTFDELNRRVYEMELEDLVPYMVGGGTGRRNSVK